MQSAVDFFHSHPMIGLATLVAAGAFAYLRPKEMSRLALAGLIVGVVAYVVSFVVDLTATGMQQKENLLGDPARTTQRLP